MAIKLKGWTARRSVKICCVILIPVLLFISMSGAYGLIKLDDSGGADFDLIFANLSKYDYFYDRYIANVLNHAHTMFWLQSEEHIRSMGCLEWQPRETIDYANTSYTAPTLDNYDEDTSEHTLNKPLFPATVVVYDLVSTNRLNGWHWGYSIDAEDLGTPISDKLVDDAIQQQLYEYNYAKNRLDEMPGLSFIITDGSRWVANVPGEREVNYFRSQPVYWIVDNGKTLEQSRSSVAYSGNADHGYGVGSYYDTGYRLSCYIAFSNDAVLRQNAIWKTAQRELFKQLAVIIAPVAIAVACLIILFAGAGRKYDDAAVYGPAAHSSSEHGSAGNRYAGSGAAGNVNFMVIDKPWLDIGLCALGVFEALVIYGFYELVRAAWRYSNDAWIIALCAAVSAFASLPLLWWLLSFVKRCKAGEFWRHTLVYALIHAIASSVRSFAKSLWAGFPLTMKAILLGAALFIANIICVAVAYPDGPAALLLALLVAVLVTFALLRYSRRLHLVEQGAKSASGGKYDDPIAVKSGNLGSIAASINNISGGINIAVAERMKSERMKTELITNISHDIRTPLTSLITYSDLLKSEGLDHERAPEYLDVIIQKSARLKTLTDDLFEASKAASGNIEVNVGNLDLADFVRQVLGELDEKVQASQLDFRLNLPEHSPVRADGKLLWRVMENLFSNVFKYAQAGSRVYIDVAGEDDWFRLDIKNISEQPLNVDPTELTERFKRGDDARSGDGSGLGLSIAQSFVLAQGGRFSLAIDGDLFKASVRLPCA